MGIALSKEKIKGESAVIFSKRDESFCPFCFLRATPLFGVALEKKEGKGRIVLRAKQERGSRLFKKTTKENRDSPFWKKKEKGNRSSKRKKKRGIGRKNKKGKGDSHLF